MIPVLLISSVLLTILSVTLVSEFFGKNVGLSQMNGAQVGQSNTGLTISQRQAVVTPISPPTPTPKPGFTIIFVGDMMFDRHIRQKSSQLGGYDQLLSEPLQNLLNTADIVIGNLEGPITDQPSKSVNSAIGSSANYIFTFDPAIISALKKFNIPVVNLGNNHILNFGHEGEAKTKAVLGQAGIGFFGDTGVESDTRTHTTLINGTRVGFANYNQFVTNGVPHAKADLAELSQTTDVQILYTHWGNEYVPENSVLKQLAREFIQAGADIIIGSHPHVITGSEIIGDIPVFYSLGNFIFDQYFEPAVQEGLIVIAQYEPTKKQFSVQERQVKMNQNGITSLLTN